MINKENQIQEIQSSITMTVLIISFSMLFGTLFMGYMVYRVRSVTWPPMGMSDVGILYPSISTIVILFSSIFYYLFESSLKNDNTKNTKFFLAMSLLLGLGFCGTQFLVWNDLALKGITQSSGIFGSMIYGFTWIHIAHVAIGILLLIWLNIKYMSGVNQDIKSELRVRNVGKFWHFLGLVWLLMYLILFLF